MAAPEPVTLAQIAKRAGVHVSTVSRALADNATGVGSATASRIRALAEEMGYHPDPAASALRTRRSGALGIIMPRLTDYVLARIYEGADEAAHDIGYTTLVANSNDDPALRMERLDKMLARRVEGFLIGDARLDGDDLIQALKRRGIPYVLVNRRLRGHPSVTTDDVRGGRLAGEHILGLGHRVVGVVAGPEYASTCVERTHGFVERFLSAGITVPDTCIQTSAPDGEGGHAAADALLHRHPDITAIFAINDFAAIGAMGAAREHGRTVGRDIAVIGYNDIPLASWLPVPMSSIRSPMVEMGRGGSRALHDIIAGGRPGPVLLEPTLSARDSTLEVSV
ncbi:LacI family transcriptional regulator [Pseudonocardia sp. RS11V-5]|uniref:LacI family DNA-binding transcriptional regulator n=1 Tax=Pseudonocardia terrae TaxID=2905831 RepID=UPI001E64447E|nr:LacI family DNA-binding transcriptional regulator [Pseudonocardia terrae]MCE3551509.1 LacI family transcriptional regulator [Pseudonocardia terrae]